ncbi:MAG: hypothetical protein AMJ81_02390 [Phycisphaerae bacterium SM23_33]|nr:MAG: hypothetical protein AMJ81_02390 [Phycisphaerae bacterium SM23_33]
MRKGVKRWLWYGLSLALAVGILAVLLGRQRWADFSQTLGAVDGRWLAGVVVLAGVYWLVRTARWRWMTSLEEAGVGWPTAWVSMLAGLGVGLITPLRSGEVVRPMFVPRGARMRLAGLVVIERMFDLSAVLTLCILGVFYMVFAGGVKLAGGATLPPWLLLACPPLLAVALGVPLLVHFRPARLWALLSRALPGKAKELAEVRLDRRQFVIFFLTSMLSESLSVLTVYFCLQAYGEIDLLTACALAPVVMLHNILPATPGGFGIRESLAVAVFGLMKLPGLSQAAILAAYLTNPIILLVIPGAVGVGGAWVAGVIRQIEAEAAG